MLRQHPQQKAPSQDQSQMSQRPTHITKIKSLHWPQLPPAGLGWWCVRFQPLPEILKGVRFFRPIGKSETLKTPNLFGAQKIPKNVWDATSVFGPRLEWCVGFFPETERPNVWENLPMRQKKLGVQEKQSHPETFWSKKWQKSMAKGWKRINLFPCFSFTKKGCRLFLFNNSLFRINDQNLRLQSQEKQAKFCANFMCEKASQAFPKFQVWT